MREPEDIAAERIAGMVSFAFVVACWVTSYGVARAFHGVPSSSHIYPWIVGLMLTLEFGSIAINGVVSKLAKKPAQRWLSKKKGLGGTLDNTSKAFDFLSIATIIITAGAIVFFLMVAWAVVAIVGGLLAIGLIAS